MSFGTPRTGGRAQRKFEKLKEGSLAFRILPPVGNAEAEGVWSKFYRIHYGYKNSEGKLRPFQSPLIKNGKTKMVEAPDAALERIEKLEAQMEIAKEAGDTAMIAKITKLIGNGKELGQYNLDSNHYLNALDSQGNIVILKLRHKAMLALLAARKKMQDEEGVDPIAVEGRYLVFTRSGMGPETTFSVAPLQQVVTLTDGRKVKEDVAHTANDAVYNRCVRKNADGSFTYLEAADLLNLFPKPSSEDVARIVKEGVTAIDEILGVSKSAGSAGASESSETAAAAEEEIPEGDIGSEYNLPPPTNTTVAAAQKAAAAVVNNPTPAAAKAAATKAAPNLAEMSDEDFLATLG